MSDVDRLRTEIQALGAEINSLGLAVNTGGTDRDDLERRTAALCEAASALPADEARRLTDDLGELIEALNAVEARLRTSGVAADSASPQQSARTAAAAYSATASARRRGS